MKIIANHYILRYFSKIDLFTVDLGTNLTGAVETKKTNNKFKLIIKDEFIKKYQNINDTFIQKYGNIGNLAFYEDPKFSQFEFHIYNNDKIYEINATNEDLEDDPSTYLINALIAIENAEKSIPEEYDMIKNVVYTTGDDISTPDLSLPKDQYIDELINYRKKIDKDNE